MNISSLNGLSMAPHIVCVETKEFFPLSDISTSIGRSKDNDIVMVTDLSLSRRHAVITKVEKKYYLKDLTSSNGTLLNGNLVSELVELKPNDEIFLGRSKMLFCPSDRRLAAATAAAMGLDQNPLAAVLSFLLPWRTSFAKFSTMAKHALTGDADSRTDTKDSLPSIQP